MSIIYILIPIAVLLTSLGIYLFFWAVKTEQFDDLEKQGMSILFDEDEQRNELQVASSEQKEDKSSESAVASNEHIHK
ncbi:cytochrome oxidase maturation protein, cbb3-type [Colwellia sp. 39_35_sub15_T18]|nr:cytochrome oxidase maturation protein, cbb3-type [Colwellia sp. 39_35_sub15_T18]